jgi:hypothetical protein
MRTVIDFDPGNAVMLRAIILAPAAALAVAFSAVAAAEDNPILQERLEQMIIAELSKHNSQETAWYSEKTRNKQKWSEGKVLGRPIRLASWTEESKSWVWLEGPKSTLSLDLKRLAIRSGRIEFAVVANAQARFKAWGRIPKLAQASVGGTVRAQIDIEGSAEIGDGHLRDGKITTLKGEVHELQFNNDLAHPFEDIAKDSLNDYVKDNNEKLRTSLEKAINRVHF